MLVTPMYNSVITPARNVKNMRYRGKPKKKGLEKNTSTGATKGTSIYTQVRIFLPSLSSSCFYKFPPQVNL
jgi:hypothetical protein